MAINDYITCCKCDVKLIYDGGKDNNRQWWEERWGKEPEILCPDCEKKLEPVAWIQPKTVDAYLRPDLGYETCSKSDYGAFPVYTAPPQRKPLTDLDIADIYKKWDATQGVSMADFARAIEAKLKEKNG